MNAHDQRIRFVEDAIAALDAQLDAIETWQAADDAGNEQNDWVDALSNVRGGLIDMQAMSSSENEGLWPDMHAQMDVLFEHKIDGPNQILSGSHAAMLLVRTWLTDALIRMNV